MAILELPEWYKQISLEAAKRDKERDAEARKRNAEAAKRNAEAAKRDVEAAKRDKERDAEARKRDKERDAEARKRNAEAVKRSAELNKEIKELKESIKSTEKLVNATTISVKNMQIELSGIAKSNGMMAEEMVFNSLNKTKTFANVRFDDIDRKVKLHSKFLNLKGEFDVVLKNGDMLAIIEIKYKVQPEDVTKLATKQLTNFRNLFPMFSNYKIMLGMAGMSFEDSSEEYAKEKGIGVIKVSPDKVEYYTKGIRLY